MADVPNFGALSADQQALNNDAATRTTQANRADQYGPMGSISWGYNPTTGTWSQNSALNGQAQGLFNNTLGWQNQLGSVVGSGVPMASFGAQQNVIDAWNALQTPGLNKAADAARARAAAQGITAGSNAWSDIERTIGTNAATSRNQGILQGVDAYNKLYQNQLAGFKANQDAMTSLTGIRDSLNPNKWAPEYKTATAYTPRNLYGAAGDTFAAQRDIENYDLASRNSLISGASGLIGGLGGLSGIGSALSGVGSLASSAWGGAKDLWNSWTGAYNAAPGNTYTGTNDFTGINGNNALATWATYGSGGD